MKPSLVLTGMLATALAQQETPTHDPFTPYFHLQVARSSNSSLNGLWMTVYGGLGAYLGLTRNASEAATFYAWYFRGQEPAAHTVLVDNSTGYVAGVSNCDTCGLPYSAAGFFKPLPEWLPRGGFIYDFGLADFDGFEGPVAFNSTDDGGLAQTVTQSCEIFGSELPGRFIVTEKPQGGPCAEIELRWTLALPKPF